MQVRAVPSALMASRVGYAAVLIVLVLGGLVLWWAARGETDETIVQQGTDSADDSGRRADGLAESLWEITTIDGNSSGGFVHIVRRGEGWETSFGNDCAIGSGDLRPAEGGFAILGITWRDGACGDKKTPYFPEGAVLTVNGRELAVRSPGHEVLAVLWESISETGPVEVPLPPTTVPPPTTAPPLPTSEVARPTYTTTTAEPTIRITSQHEAPPIVPETTNLRFPECIELYQTEPSADGQSVRDLRETRRAISAGRRKGYHIGSTNGPNAWGVLSVGLSHRSQETIDWLTELAAPDELCLDLPPVGHYDQPLTYLRWELLNAQAVTADTTTVLLQLDQRCGFIEKERVLVAEVEYGDTEIRIGVPTRVATWGDQNDVCLPPDVIEVELDEPLAGRDLALRYP